jgi:exodeoxyribonuclease VII small subunit
MVKAITRRVETQVIPSQFVSWRNNPVKSDTFIIYLHMSKSAKASPPQNFEIALAELEQVVAAMEAGALPLDQSLSAYQRGMDLLRFCQSALQDAQQQVKILEAGELKSFESNGDELHAGE